MTLRSAPLRMFAALLIGLGVGLVTTSFKIPGQAVMLAVAQPVGQLWLDALTMTVVPLVFGLIVTGVAGAASSASSGSVAVRALFWFAILLTVACLLSAITATGILTLWPVAADAAAMQFGAAPEMAPATEWYQGIIPTNPIKAASETAMVPLVIFALLFGLAASRIEKPLGDLITKFFDAVVQTMLVIVGWVLWIAPLGILALAYTAAVRMGLGAAGTLVHYILVVVAVCLVTMVMAYGMAAVFGRISLLRFARTAAPAQAIAISTQSSLASLPIMIEATDALGIQKASAGVVLPLAVSIFRAASAAANVAVAVYLGHLHGVPLSLPVLAIGALIAVPVSLAAVGLPAQVSFFATIGPVCLAMGVPIEALPLLLAVETIPDLFRTVGNVTADLAVARIASEWMPG